MPIGVFARRSGLTSSALRFYDDCGLLAPAEVDPDSGYRYYSAEQMPRATVLRRLREIGMPLTAVEAVLDAAPGDAARLIDEHVARLHEDAVAARRKAVVIKSSLSDVPGLPIAALKGPVLADAVEQVLTATARDPRMPVLGGLCVEAAPEAITLTATDRYWLSTRTLVPAESAAATPAAATWTATTPAATTWAGTVDGDELRTAAAEARRSPLVRVEATPYGIWLRMAAGREDQYCRLLGEEYPDHRSMLASLPAVTTRVTIAKDLLLRALEGHSGEHIALRIDEHGMYTLTTGDERAGHRIPATVTGQALGISFAQTTLYPAVSTAVGPDVLLDLRGADQPATIRSADRGDLTTLAMPIKPAPAT